MVSCDDWTHSAGFSVAEYSSSTLKSLETIPTDSSRSLASHPPRRPGRAPVETRLARGDQAPLDGVEEGFLRRESGVLRMRERRDGEQHQHDGEQAHERTVSHNLLDGR